MVGIGGEQLCFLERGMLSFQDDPFMYRYFLDIFIADVRASMGPQERPSLLGRDFLNLCDVRLNHARNLVALEPLNVDSGFIRPPLLPA